MTEMRRKPLSKAATPPTLAELRARLTEADESVTRSFRMLGLNDAQIGELRSRVNAGESVESLMADMKMYRAGGTLARAVLAVRMGVTAPDPFAVRATPTRLELGTAPRLQGHERAALAAKMGVSLGDGERAGAGVSSTACKLTLGCPSGLN